jgi:hypothetical protein
LERLRTRFLYIGFELSILDLYTLGDSEKVFSFTYRQFNDSSTLRRIDPFFGFHIMTSLKAYRLNESRGLMLMAVRDFIPPIRVYRLYYAMFQINNRRHADPLEKTCPILPRSSLRFYSNLTALLNSPGGLDSCELTDAFICPNNMLNRNAVVFSVDTVYRITRRRSESTKQIRTHKLFEDRIKPRSFGPVSTPGWSPSAICDGDL